MRAAFIAVSFAVLLGACASAPRGPGDSPIAAPPKPIAAPVLAQEKRWLEGWFAGTPVVIALAGDAGLRVEVPLEFGFASGQAKVKPALAAVLDKVAQSLQRHATARVQVTAPGVPERTASVRDYLAAKGVVERRITRRSTQAGPVELLVSVPQAIERLEDPPAPGR